MKQKEQMERLEMLGVQVDEIYGTLYLRQKSISTQLIRQGYDLRITRDELITYYVGHRDMIIVTQTSPRMVTVAPLVSTDLFEVTID